MRYLYGDSTPFPLNSNFLETAMAATDAAVSLLEVEDTLQGARRTEDETKQRASRRQAEVNAVEACMRDALREAGGVGGAGEELVGKLQAVIEQELEGSREHIELWQQKVLAGTRHGFTPCQLYRPIERFFQREELPGTKWGMRWKAGGVGSAMAQVYAVTPMGLTATLAVDIPAKHLWMQPFRLGEVQRELVVQIMGKGWFGRPKMRKEKLHKYFVTRVTCTADREVLVLRKKVREGAPGIKVTLRERDDKTVRAVRVDGNEDETGPVAVLAGLEATLLKRAWRSMISTLEPLLKKRGKLLAAMLDGRDIAKVDSPGLLAAVFIQSVGPIIRGLTRHSRSSGELQLKRELGDGRREELFVRYSDLSDKYAELSAVSRDLFSAYGLDPNAMTMPPPAMFEAKLAVEPEPTYELPPHMANFNQNDNGLMPLENAETLLDSAPPPPVYQELARLERYHESLHAAQSERVQSTFPSAPPLPPSEWAAMDAEDDDELETLTAHSRRPWAKSDIAPRRAAAPPVFQRASAFSPASQRSQMIPPPPMPPRPTPVPSNVVPLSQHHHQHTMPPPPRRARDDNAVTRREHRGELRLASG